MGSNDDTPRWLRDYQPIEVDLGTLGQFAKALQDEVEQNFRPHAARLVNSLDPGQDPFRRSEGFLELTAAWYSYADSRDRAIQLLSAYASATSILASAAQLIVQRYGDSDAFAAAQADDVQAAFAAVKPGGVG